MRLVKLGPHKRNRNRNKTLMTKVVTEQKKVLYQPILLQLLKKDSIFQIGENKLWIGVWQNSHTLSICRLW
jgi:hypothetical protein